MNKTIDLSSIESATLLSCEEVKKYGKMIPPVEENWWLRSPGISVRQATCVNGKDGYVDGAGGYVNFVDDAVRPALQSSNPVSFQTGEKFAFGEHTFTYLGEGLAICNDIVGKCAFRKDWNAPDANVYEASDVKKYVDNWLEKIKEKEYTGWELQVKQAGTNDYVSSMRNNMQKLGADLSGYIDLELKSLEDNGVIPVFDAGGNLLSTKSDYTLGELCERETAVQLAYKECRYLTRKEDAAYLSYMKDNLDAEMKAAEAVIRYALMTGKAVTDKEHITTPLTLDNLDKWLNSVPRLDLADIACRTAFEMKDKCDIRFDTTGTILTDKSRGELVGSLKDVIEGRNESAGIAVNGYIETNCDGGEYDKEKMSHELSKAAMDEILSDIHYRMDEVDSNVLMYNDDLSDFIQNSDYDQDAFEEFIAEKISGAVENGSLEVEDVDFDPYYEDGLRQGTDYVAHINIYAKDLIAEFEEAMKEKTEVEEPDR